VYHCKRNRAKSVQSSVQRNSRMRCASSIFQLLTGRGIWGTATHIRMSFPQVTHLQPRQCKRQMSTLAGTAYTTQNCGQRVSTKPLVSPAWVAVIGTSERDGWVNTPLQLSRGHCAPQLARFPIACPSASLAMCIVARLRCNHACRCWIRLDRYVVQD
jgi:hypothetical protein